MYVPDYQQVVGVAYAARSPICQQSGIVRLDENRIVDRLYLVASDPVLEFLERQG